MFMRRLFNGGNMRYNVKTIWEHDFRKLRERGKMNNFLDTFDIVTDLEPPHIFWRAGEWA